MIDADLARKIQRALGDARYKAAGLDYDARYRIGAFLDVRVAREQFFNALDLAEQMLGLWLRLDLAVRAQQESQAAIQEVADRAARDRGE